MRIGIIGAMNEEVALILSDMKTISQDFIGNRNYYTGFLHGMDVVLTFSGWGKVASASTTTVLLIRYGVEAIIFSGVAGAASPELNIGDIVVATELVQHDLDASPIFPKYQVPLLGISRFKTDTHLQKNATWAAESFVSSDIAKEIPRDLLVEFDISKPTVHRGLIASGDQFITDPIALANIRNIFPRLKCIEMEGASVAQICYEYNIPFVVIRTISDRAGKNAEAEFNPFILKVASHYSRGIVRNLLIRLQINS